MRAWHVYVFSQGLNFYCGIVQPEYTTKLITSTQKIADGLVLDARMSASVPAVILVVFGNVGSLQ